MHVTRFQIDKAMVATSGSVSVSALRRGGRGGVVVRLLACHQGEPGSIPGSVVLGFLQVDIVPEDGAGQRVFSGISRFPHLSFRRLSFESLAISSSDMWSIQHLLNQHTMLSVILQRTIGPPAATEFVTDGVQHSPDVQGPRLPTRETHRGLHRTAGPTHRVPRNPIRAGGDEGDDQNILQRQPNVALAIRGDPSSAHIAFRRTPVMSLSTASRKLEGDGEREKTLSRHITLCWKDTPERYGIHVRTMNCGPWGVVARPLPGHQRLGRGTPEQMLGKTITSFLLLLPTTKPVSPPGVPSGEKTSTVPCSKASASVLESRDTWRQAGLGLSPPRAGLSAPQHPPRDEEKSASDSHAEAAGPLCVTSASTVLACSSEQGRDELKLHKLHAITRFSREGAERKKELLEVFKSTQFRVNSVDSSETATHTANFTLVGKLLANQNLVTHLLAGKRCPAARCSQSETLQEYLLPLFTTTPSSNQVLRLFPRRLPGCTGYTRSFQSLAEFSRDSRFLLMMPRPLVKCDVVEVQNLSVSNRRWRTASPPNTLTHSRLHSSVSHPLDQSRHEHLARRRPAITCRPHLTSLAHTRQTASVKDCRPLDCSRIYSVLGRHLESSPTRVMRRGGLRCQSVSPEHSCVVAKRIGNSSRREEFCDASKSRHCRHSRDYLKGGGSRQSRAHRSRERGGRGGSPITMRGFIPDRSLRSFANGHSTGQCRWSAGFLRDILFPPPLYSSDAPFSPHFTLIGYQDLVVKRVATAKRQSHGGNKQQRGGRSWPAVKATLRAGLGGDIPKGNHVPTGLMTLQERVLEIAQDRVLVRGRGRDINNASRQDAVGKHALQGRNFLVLDVQPAGEEVGRENPVRWHWECAAGSTTDFGVKGQGLKSRCAVRVIWLAVRARFSSAVMQIPAMATSSPRRAQVRYIMHNSWQTRAVDRLSELSASLGRTLAQRTGNGERFTAHNAFGQDAVPDESNRNWTRSTLQKLFPNLLTARTLCRGVTRAQHHGVTRALCILRSTVLAARPSLEGSSATVLPARM
ncbi:hypothetical protein PR048_017463 [Dryococelus australis]|uniref:Uncharacterized protein n=1 Tax=Dryococelus australis TaxID=614101 RepID=A0ABQ9H9T3_9NEOP|nr:hypothetical protein PR048_017463 [Dryococelus australis]